MSFSDLLKKPLPSKQTEEEVKVESAEDDVALAVEAGEGSDTDVVAKLENDLGELDDVQENSDNDEADAVVEDADEDDLDDDLEDIDLSELSDDELDEMEEDLRDSDLDDVVGDVEPVELTAEEEREADDLMCLAGTTELIKSELSADERKAFLESATETQVAVFEGFLLESDVLHASEKDDEVMTEAKMYNKTTVRFSREDRKAQLYAVALNVSARAHNDPDYIKLQKVQKIRRVLKKKIQRKYHAEAVRRMKVYYNRLRSSKSPVLSNLGKKLSESSKNDD